MVRIKSDRQHLLAAVRRGDWRALLPLADLWQDDPECKLQTEAWEKFLASCRWVMTTDRRLRNGARKNVAFYFRDFAYKIKAIEGCWRLYKFRRFVGPRGECPLTWKWCMKIADGLIPHLRSTLPIPAEQES